MKFTELDINGVFLIESQIYRDDRGFFLESFNQKEFHQTIDKDVIFVHDNHSQSKKNVFRGLHFQKPPHAQAKLVRVTKGKALDVFLDIRENSSTYGKIGKYELSSDDGKCLYIPKGIAHGFLALENETHFQYKCSDYYHPESEESILIEESKDFSIKLDSLLRNKKDLKGIVFKDFVSPF